MFLSVLLRYLGRLPAARGLSASDTERALALSIWEGALYTVAISLVGGPYLAGYAMLMGAGPRGVAMVTAIPALAGAVQVVAAPLVARARRRVGAIAAGAAVHRVGWGLAGFLPLLLPDHLWFRAYAGAVLVAHMGQASVVPAWYSLMSDLAREKVRGRYFGIRNSIHAAVAVVTILTAGSVLDQFPGMRGFLLLHGGTALFGLANASAILAHPEPRRPATAAASPLAPLTNPAFRLVAAFVATWTLSQTLSAPYYPIVMLKRLGLPYTHVSWLMVTAALATVGSLFLWGPLCDRVGEGRLISYLAPVAATVPLGWLFASGGGLPLLFVLHAMMGAAAAGINLALANLNLAIAGDGPDQMPYLAFFAAVIGLTGGIGPLAGGLAGRPEPVFVVSAAASWVLWAVWWYWYRPHRVLRAAMNHRN